MVTDTILYVELGGQDYLFKLWVLSSLSTSDLGAERVKYRGGPNILRGILVL